MPYSISLLNTIKKHIKSGGIIIYPTEYCYGIGCDPKNNRAIQKLYKIKARNKKKPCIVVASNLFEIKQLSDMKVVPFMMEKWKLSPTSFLMFAKKTILKHLSINNKIAIRLTSKHSIHQICSTISSGIISTSANLNHKYPLKTYRDCCRIFGNIDNVIVMNGSTQFYKKPSTIIDLETKKILR